MVSVFFSYAHKDEDLREQLETHLATMKRQGVISTWHDRRLIAGTNFDTEISRELNQADIILLLVSSDFLASDYCYGVEMSRALERHAAGEARVIPIILRPCDWTHTPFGKLLPAPKDGKPVTTWINRDEAFLDIARAIRAAAAAVGVNGSLPETESTARGRTASATPETAGLPASSQDGLAKPTAPDGLHCNIYTDRRAGFELRLGDPDYWSILPATDIPDPSGNLAKGLVFPEGVLADKPVTFLTDNAAVVFLSTRKLAGGKASLWVFHMPEQAKPVEQFVSEETGEMGGLRRTGSVVMTFLTSQNVWKARRSQKLLPEKGRKARRVQLTKVQYSTDHKNALLFWSSPYYGLKLDILGRVIMGPKDCYYAVAVKVKNASPTNKTNVELKTMLDSFKAL